MSFGRECAVCRGGIHSPGTRLHKPFVTVRVAVFTPRKHHRTVYIHDACGGQTIKTAIPEGR